MLSTVEFTVESLSAHHVVEKLSRAGIPVLMAKSMGKTSVRVRIASKDRKKAFAILRGSCYNVKNLSRHGGARLLEWARRAAGLILGTVLFAGVFLFMESRVLKVKISGSGAYYEREIMEILREEGVHLFSAFPEDTGPLTAKVLSLDRVEFCSFRLKGGVLTVGVEVGEEARPLDMLPLLAPASGRIEELIVVRGTPLFAEGDAVKMGEVVVADSLPEGGKKIAVIARVTVRYRVDREYTLPEQEALAQAFLDFGELKDLHIRKTERGCRISGTAFSTASVGLD